MAAAARERLDPGLAGTQAARRGRKDGRTPRQRPAQAVIQSRRLARVAGG